MIEYSKTGHKHKGIDEPRISIKDLTDTIQTVATTPTSIPEMIYNQIIISSQGGTPRLLIYDKTNSAWIYLSAKY